ncbi:MAG: hypothetical protein JWO30_1817 [Fibrobacteres bacterium]|nr:hypothetical protein [Fibrobacterota bacterium]
MKSLSEQLAFYQSYHRTPGCKATHFLGVPLVTFSILIPMGWLSLDVSGHRVTLAMAFVLSALVYYFLLEPVLATLMTLTMLPMTWAADWISRLPFGTSLSVFIISFVLGWAFQLIGHAIEGKRPALLVNFVQAVLTAPLFLWAEVLLALGWKGPLANGRADGGGSAKGGTVKP